MRFNQFLKKLLVAVTFLTGFLAVSCSERNDFEGMAIRDGLVSTSNWVTKTNIPTKRWGGNAGAVIETKIYVIGGGIVDAADKKLEISKDLSYLQYYPQKSTYKAYYLLNA